jgi:hypothetical protein
MPATLTSVYFLQLLPTCYLPLSVCCRRLLLPSCCLPTACLLPPPFAVQLLPAFVCLPPLPFAVQLLPASVCLLPSPFAAQLLPACSAAAAVQLFACRFPAAFPTGCLVLACYLVAAASCASHLRPVCLPAACRPALGLLHSSFRLGAFLLLLAACMVTSS